MTATVHNLANPRLRFNWGFWDGIDDDDKNRATRDVADHHDKVYANGYQFGNLFAKRGHVTRTTNSDSAWNTWLNCVEKTNPAQAGELAAAADNLAAEEA